MYRLQIYHYRKEQVLCNLIGPKPSKGDFLRIKVGDKINFATFKCLACSHIFNDDMTDNNKLEYIQVLVSG